MKTGIFVCLFTFFNYFVVYADDIDQIIDRTVEQIRLTSDRGIKIQIPFVKPEDRAYAAAEYAKRITSLTSQIEQSSLTQLAISLEQSRLASDLHSIGYSDNVAMAQALAEAFQTTRYGTVKSHIVEFLYHSFSPDILDQYKTDLTVQEPQRIDKYLVLLYGLLPSLSESEVNDLIERFIAQGSDIKPATGQLRADLQPKRMDYVDSVRARKGVKQAEKRLQEWMKTVRNGGGISISEFADVMANVDSYEMKYFLAQGLRSEDCFFESEFSCAKNRLYAEVLVRMLGHEDGFPVLRKHLRYSEVDMDLLEKWCANRLGINYAPETRKTYEAIIEGCKTESTTSSDIVTNPTEYALSEVPQLMAATATETKKDSAVAVANLAGCTDPKVVELIDLIINGRTNTAMSTDYEVAHWDYLAIQIVKCGQYIENVVAVMDSLKVACVYERQRLFRTGKKTSISDNEELLDEIVNLYNSTKIKKVRSLIIQILYSLYSPDSLVLYKNDLLTGIENSPNPYLLLLLNSMPAITKEEIGEAESQFVGSASYIVPIAGPTEVNTKVRMENFVDSVRAHHGVITSQDRLIKKLESAHEGRFMDFEELADIIAHVNTSEMKSFVAAGLRSEECIESQSHS